MNKWTDVKFARCIPRSDKEYAYTPAALGFFPNAIYEIVSITSHPYPLCICMKCNGELKTIHSDWVVPWTPEVGDNVLITSASSGNASFNAQNGLKAILTSPISIAKDVWECKITENEAFGNCFGNIYCISSSSDKWIVQSRCMVPIVGIAPVCSKPIQEEKWPHVCPNCGAPAYIGFSEIDCSKKCR